MDSDSGNFGELLNIVLIWSLNPYYPSTPLVFRSLTVTTEGDVEVTSFLTDPRLDRLFGVGREINQLRSKIGAATDYIRNAPHNGDIGDVVMARESLRSELDRGVSHAKSLMPIVEELVERFEGEIRTLHERKKLHQGLAKIEGFAGTKPVSEGYESAAARDNSQITALTNLVGALDELERDLTKKKEVVACPRCSSHDVSYRITPSELGYTLYKCSACSNAWRIQQFTLNFG